jgi:dolichol-phosphate mannosyltransferase
LINSTFHDSKIKILGDGINRGPGYAFNLAFDWVLGKSNSKDDIIVTMESDCTSDLSILNIMLSLNRMGFNLILASVYAQGGGFDNTTISRRLISSIANILYRFLFNIQVQTISSFYRVYSIELLSDIKFKYNKIIEENGFICMLEILIKSISCNAKIIEVPMTLQSNKRIGKSKMKIIKTTIQYFIFLYNTKISTKNRI